MQLEDALTTVEHQLQVISAALLAADPQALETGSTQLRNAAAQLSQVMEQISREGVAPAGLQKRLQAVGALLAVQRESLARLAAITDRQAAGLLPPRRCCRHIWKRHGRAQCRECGPHLPVCELKIYAGAQWCAHPVLGEAPPTQTNHPAQWLRIFARSRAIDWLCNWHTRDSVTPSTAAISFRFMSCS